MDIFDFSDGREGYYGEYGGFFTEILHHHRRVAGMFPQCKAGPNSGRTMLP